MLLRNKLGRGGTRPYHIRRRSRSFSPLSSFIPSLASVIFGDVLGTVVNAVAVLAGGIAGLKSNWSPPIRYQSYLKTALAALTAFVGLATAITSLHGSAGQIVREIGIGLLSLILGNLAGKLLQLQKSMNRLGQMAREELAKPSTSSGGAKGFLTSTIAYCASPMAMIGGTLEGIGAGSKVLLIKAVLDGLAALAFARSLGWGTILAVAPLLAYQGGITLAVAQLEPFLRDHALVDSITFVAGFLTSFLSLVILDVKKVPTGDYLPSLFIAPLLTWYWR